MRYAILSDVHGNAEALSAVLDDAARQGAQAVLCLGDMVGYGADPRACVEAVAERAVAVVAGNHDHAAVGLADLDYFNAAASAAALWTRRVLDADLRAYLAGLPLRAVIDDATLVHASPQNPEEWDYLVSEEAGLEAFGYFDTRLCFVGHSHLPSAWSVGSSGPHWEPRLAGDRSTVRLEDGRRYVINVGSVGQPRDRDPRAAYGVWDQEARTVTVRRVPYDVREAARKIVAAGLPRWLAERLSRGE